MSCHERAVKADKETIKTMKERLLKKYPYIDLSRFTILTHIGNNGQRRIPMCCLWTCVGGLRMRWTTT